MQKVTSTVSYTVPSWNFCNYDNLNQWQELSKEKCKFCIRAKDGYECLLYGTSLSSRDGMVDKTRACCKASAGFESNIDSAPPRPEPTISPKELMEYALNEYTKTVERLVKQGYPRKLAETVAKKATMEDK